MDKKMPVYVYDDPRNCLNGVPFDGTLPQYAIDKMSEALSKRTSELLSMPRFEKDREVYVRKYSR